MENTGKYLDGIKFYGEDLFLNIEIFLKAKRVKTLNSKLYYYRLCGGTYKYMPFYLDDLIIGYNTKKRVIKENFLDLNPDSNIGNSLYLLESFKAYLTNIMYSKLETNDILLKIKNDINKFEIIEACNNVKCVNYDQEYIAAIESKNIDYLYKIGEKTMKKQQIKRWIYYIINKF